MHSYSLLLTLLYLTIPRKGWHFWERLTNKVTLQLKWFAATFWVNCFSLHLAWFSLQYHFWLAKFLFPLYLAKTESWYKYSSFFLSNSSYSSFFNIFFVPRFTCVQPPDSAYLFQSSFYTATLFSICRWRIQQPHHPPRRYQPRGYWIRLRRRRLRASPRLSGQQRTDQPYRGTPPPGLHPRGASQTLGRQPAAGPKHPTIICNPNKIDPRLTRRW